MKSAIMLKMGNRFVGIGNAFISLDADIAKYPQFKDEQLQKEYLDRIKRQLDDAVAELETLMKE